MKTLIHYCSLTWRSRYDVVGCAHAFTLSSYWLLVIFLSLWVTVVTTLSLVERQPIKLFFSFQFFRSWGLRTLFWGHAKQTKIRCALGVYFKWLVLSFNLWFKEIGEPLDKERQGGLVWNLVRLVRETLERREQMPHLSIQRGSRLIQKSRQKKIPKPHQIKRNRRQLPQSW